MIGFLREYAKKEAKRFHMPGHKGKSEYMAFSSNIEKIDITEIEGSDNLHSPQGIIEQSQKTAADLFRSQKTIYLVNGSTSGIYSALMGSVRPGEKILVQRDSHRAAYNAMILGDIEGEYIYPSYNQKLGFSVGIDLSDLKESLESKDIRAVFVTSPSYYGVVQDIESIAEIAHANNALLIVDEAHGSHLPFIDDLPKSAIDKGADIVIQSTHKTLLGYTQTSMIHICSHRVDLRAIEDMTRIHQSSSPSYILMSSLDNTVRYLENVDKSFLKSYMDILRETRSQISRIDGVSLIGREDLEGNVEYDETRLVIAIDGISGSDLEVELRARNIEIEMSDSRYVVAISTIADSRGDLEYLKTAIEDIARSHKGAKREDIRVEDYPDQIERMINIRGAHYSDKRVIDIADAEGQIAGDFITPYPPGIPLLVPGEKICDHMVEYIVSLKEQGINLLGLEGDTIRVVD